MKLLCEFDTEQDAIPLSEKLKTNGIATFISSSHSNRYRLASGAYKVGLWIILDDQYKSAHDIKNNFKTHVKNKLSKKQIEDLQKKTSLATSKTIFNFMIKLTLSLLITAALVIAVLFNYK